MNPDIVTGTCECGATVEREKAEGRLAKYLNDRPFRCEPCTHLDDARIEEEQTARRADNERRQAADRLRRSSIPAALQPWQLAELDKPDRQAVLDAAFRWTDGNLPGLALVGSVGAGKTTIAAAAARRYLERGGTVDWLSTPLALSRLTADFSDPGRDRVLAALTREKGALILDDLDKARPTAFGAEAMFLAIDGAVANGRPLLLTTNLMPSQLAARWPDPYGEPIASRIAGRCETHRVGGHDRRLA